MEPGLAGRPTACAGCASSTACSCPVSIAAASRRIARPAMELRQLRYFVAIAREGSFSAASSRIGIAQPALSAQIAKLESEIGRPLLDRHRRGADLTEAGRQFLDHALDILARVDHARLSLRGRS